jgi:hypothetical protein
MVIHKQKQPAVFNSCNHHAIFEYAAEATLTAVDFLFPKLLTCALSK